MNQASSRPAAIEDVIRLCADFYRAPASSITGRRRYQSIVEVRQAAMWLARTVIGATYPAIGKAFDRHHTTAMAACDRVDEILKLGPSPLAEQLARLTEILQKGAPWTQRTAWPSTNMSQKESSDCDLTPDSAQIHSSPSSHSQNSETPSVEPSESDSPASAAT